MPIHNADIAAIFDELADLLEIAGANPFRVRAYRNAARVTQGLGRDLGELIAEGKDLTELPGIGKDLAAKIKEIYATGSAAVLTEVHKEVPASLTELLKIPGLGPKRVKVLFKQLGIKNQKQLVRAAKSGRLREIAGFGPKTEQHILDAVAAHRDGGRRFLLNVASQYAEPLVRYLQDIPGVGKVVVAGSYRRAQETVGDLDILVTSREAEAVMAAFVDYDEVEEVVSKGPTRATVMLRSGLQVDLRVVPQASFGAALHYFTGNKAHNVQIRRLGQQRGLKINEYGVFKGKQRVGGATEASVFRAVGLPLIPPELRAGDKEIAAAREGRLPTLIELEDLSGDLHAHSRATDGHASIREMAVAAQRHGLKYLAITDHSQHLKVARGLDRRRLEAQGEEIDQLNRELSGIVLLKGIEVDILENGDLDIPEEALRQLDVVVGAVHSHFGLSRQRQTKRLLCAMDHPCFSMLAHPTGRLLQERDAYDIDMARIIRHAAERGCYLELDAQPMRLDLTDVYCQMARSEGVLVSINSDAHTVDDFDNLRYGIGQARRGWLESADVLNARPLRDVRRLLNRAMV